MPHKYGGFIGFFNLSDWWSTSFSEFEKETILNIYNNNNLVEGEINYVSISVTDFLSSLATYFRKTEYLNIRNKIINKLSDEANKNPIHKPGNFKGRHYSTYVEEVKNLKRNNQFIELECLLWNLVKSTEEEDDELKYGVAPWYYHELAKLFRKQNRIEEEYQIIDRYSNKRHGYGASSQILLHRLERVKELLQSEKDKQRHR